MLKNSLFDIQNFSLCVSKGVDSSKGNGIELSVDEYAKSTHDFAQHFMRQVIIFQSHCIYNLL